MKKLANIITQEGLSGIPARIRHRYYLKTRIYRIDLSGRDFKAGPSRYRFVALAEAHLEELSRQHPEEFTVEKKRQFRERLTEEATDKVFLVIDQQEKILNYSCVSFGAAYEPRIRYLIQAIPGNLYLFDDYTFAFHRNRGVHSFALRCRLKIALEMGCRTASCMIDDGNLASERVFTKIGFQPVGIIHTWFLKGVTLKIRQGEWSW